MSSDDAGADRDRRDRRERSAPRAATAKPRAEPEQPGAAAPARARRSGARSPPRRISAGGRRAARQAGQVPAATTTPTIASQRDARAPAAAPAPGGCSLSCGEQLGRRAGHGQRAERQPERAAGQRDERGLAGVARGQPRRA